MNPADAAPLTLPQVRACRKADENEADCLAICLSYGVTLDEATEWFNSATAGAAQAVLHAIFEASGLSEGAQKSG